MGYIKAKKEPNRCCFLKAECQGTRSLTSSENYVEYKEQQLSDCLDNY
jgi:hypothetical protein